MDSPFDFIDCFSCPIHPDGVDPADGALIGDCLEDPCPFDILLHSLEVDSHGMPF